MTTRKKLEQVLLLLISLEQPLPILKKEELKEFKSKYQEEERKEAKKELESPSVATGMDEDSKDSLKAEAKVYIE